MKRAMRWTISSGRPNGNGASPALLYKYADKTAKLVYADGSIVRFECVQCAVHTQRLIMGDGPHVVNEA